MSAAGARAGLLLLPVMALPLAGCAANPAPSSTPVALRSVDFEAEIPAGWVDVTSNRTAAGMVRPAGTLLLLLEAPPPEPVYAGVNDVEAVIAVTRLGFTMPEAQFPGYLQSVALHGASAVSAPLPVSVGGTAATYVTYQSSLGGTPGETEDIAVDSAGATYEIELNTSRFAFAAQAGALRGLLASWRWVTPD